LDEAGISHEAVYLRWYHVEAMVLAGRSADALAAADALAGELADEPAGEAVGAAVARLAAVDELRASLDLARELDATYEIVRALQALEAIAPQPDPAWGEERERLCAQLGVVALPPVTVGDPRDPSGVGSPPLKGEP
jgi:hypothetical protein